LEAEEVDGQTIQFNVTGDPSNGSVTISGTIATYTPNQDWFGTDTFNFEATDVTSKSILNNATGTITVNPINDAPTVDDINNVEVSNGQSVDITLTGSDVENDNLTFEIVDSPIERPLYNLEVGQIREERKALEFMEKIRELILSDSILVSLEFLPDSKYVVTIGPLQSDDEVDRFEALVKLFDFPNYRIVPLNGGNNRN